VNVGCSWRPNHVKSCVVYFSAIDSWLCVLLPRAFFPISCFINFCVKFQCSYKTRYSLTCTWSSSLWVFGSSKVIFWRSSQFWCDFQILYCVVLVNCVVKLLILAMSLLSHILLKCQDAHSTSQYLKHSGSALVPQVQARAKSLKEKNHLIIMLLIPLSILARV